MTISKQTKELNIQSVTNVKIYVESYDESDLLKIPKIKAVSAIIDGEQHCTGDIRCQDIQICLAVFSKITKNQPILDSIEYLVKEGQYKSFDILPTDVIREIYIYVALRINDVIK